MFGFSGGETDPALGAVLHPEQRNRLASCHVEAAEKAACEALLVGRRGFVAHRATATEIIRLGRHVGVPL